MKRFERALLDARLPNLAIEEFRRALRRDLVAADRHRRAHRARAAIGGLSAAVAILGVLLLLFVVRPSVPVRLNERLFHDPAARAAGNPLPQASMDPLQTDRPLSDIDQLLTRAGTSALTDRRWIDEWYGQQPNGARVKALEDERIFAVRRFELTSGKRILVYTELGGEPQAEAITEYSAIQDF